LERIAREISFYGSFDGEKANYEITHDLQKLRDQYREAVLEIQPELWELLLQYRITISTVTNWDAYRRAAEISTEKRVEEVTEKKDQD
jgi:hypothetical protein